MEHLDPQDPLVLAEAQEHQDHQGLMGHQVLADLQVVQEHLDHLVLLETDMLVWPIQWMADIRHRYLLHLQLD